MKQIVFFHFINTKLNLEPKHQHNISHIIYLLTAKQIEKTYS